MNNHRQNLNMRNESLPIIYSFFVGVIYLFFTGTKGRRNVTKDYTGFSMGFLATGSLTS